MIMRIVERCLPKLKGDCNVEGPDGVDMMEKCTSRGKDR